MNYAFSNPYGLGKARRGGLLGIVVALHAGMLLFILAAKTVVPALLETPLTVHFIEPSKPVEVEAASRPLPVEPPKREATRPVTPRKTSVQPRPPNTPPLETTASAGPAPASAPVVPEPLPVAAPPAASPGSSAGTSKGSGPGGGEVVGARFDADYLKNPAPPYPPQSRRLGEEGKVILRVLVTVEGGAQEVELKTSSGSSRLDDSAHRTVRTWKFVPAKRGGIAVESWVLVPILFKLEQ